MFQVQKKIRFHHCDPAGIVFFPNYQVFCHEVLEDWLDDGLGIGFAHTTKVRGLIMPAVKLTTEYLAPSSFNDVLTFKLIITKLGNSSMTLLITAEMNAQQRMRTELIVVMAQTNPFKSVRIPDDIRNQMLPFVQSQA